MKTIEEKAKRFNEALKAAVVAHKDEDKHLKATLERIFPELKESEDEKMIQYFKDLAPFDKADELYEKYGFSHKDAIAWLKKQGDANKEYWRGYREGKQEILDKYAELEKQGEQKPQGKTALEAIKEEKVDNANKVEQKSAWSEEDEYCRHQLIVFCENCMVSDSGAKRCAHWLKSLKNRVQPQPKQKCSEWDRSKIQRICKYLDEAKKYYADITEVRECIEWLKFLRPQYIWQPSDEQMDALKGATNIVGCKYKSYLNSLYSDLKKLK